MMNLPLLKLSKTELQKVKQKLYNYNLINNNMKNNKGFSLVELIIVIAIMAVLVTVIVPTMFQYIEKSKRAVDIQNADSFIQASRAVITDHQLDTKYDDEHYSTSVAWNKDSKFNADNPKTLVTVQNP